jgi:hypothetical protein
MSLIGNHYSAKQDRMGNWTITRLSDLASVYLQGDDAVEFTDNHRVLGAETYPNRIFKTAAEHVDACLDCYDVVMSSAVLHGRDQFEDAAEQQTKQTR